MDIINDYSNNFNMEDQLKENYPSEFLKQKFSNYINFFKINDIFVVNEDSKIPSVEVQQKVVQYLDYVFKNSIEKNLKQISDLKRINEFWMGNYDFFGKIPCKKLYEVCEINYGTNFIEYEENLPVSKGNLPVSKGDLPVSKGNLPVSKGDFPVYGYRKENFTTNNYNREGLNILIGTYLPSKESIQLVNEKLFLNENGITLQSKSNDVFNDFICYYFYTKQELILNCTKGIGKKLDIRAFENIKIYIPTLEVQKDIVKYCESNYKLIRNIEIEIELSKRDVQNIMKNIFLQ